MPELSALVKPKQALAWSEGENATGNWQYNSKDGNSNGSFSHISSHCNTIYQKTFLTFGFMTLQRSLADTV